MDVVRILSTILGLIVVATTFFWTAQVMMVKGADPPYFARVILRASRNFLHFAGSIRRSSSFQQNLWALYVPFSLIAMVIVTLALACIGFAMIIYGITKNTPREALVNSISSMSVLGFAGLPRTMQETVVAGFEAFTGPIFVALLIGYIVNIYAAYSNQHERVMSMDAQLATSTDGADLLANFAVDPGLDGLTPVWTDWADEFQEIGQSYRTVDGYLLVFAPVMTKHWSVNSVLVLDSANLRNTLVALPPDPEADRCLTVGSDAIDLVAKHYRHRSFSIRRKKTPQRVTREDFMACAERLRAASVPVARDLDVAWNQFEYKRGNYASATTQLEHMT